MAGDDDFFDDSDDDVVFDSTLQALEQHALSSTQLARPPPLKSTNALRRDIAWRPPQPQAQHRQLQTAPPASAPAPPSSDYGFEDESIIDLDDSTMVIEPASGPRRQVPPQAYPSTAEETAAAFAAADAELGAAGPSFHRPAQAPQPRGRDADAALTARIAALEREHANLEHSAREAKASSLAKAGEIAIVRANAAKAAREYERRIEAMRAGFVEEAKRKDEELQKGRREREAWESERRFAVHDEGMMQEGLRGVGRLRVGTPRKEKKSRREVGGGDGFGEEVAVGSPSRRKGEDRQKDLTPKLGVKRKRSTLPDSPVPALSFSQRPAASIHTETSISQPSVSGDDLFESIYPSLLNRILQHRSYSSAPRTLERLAQHHFPEAPEQSLAAHLLDFLASKPAPKDVEESPLPLCHLLLTQWTRCLDAEMYAPIEMLIDLIQSALFGHLSATTAQLIEVAVPLGQRTIAVVAVPTIEAAAGRAPSNNVDPAALATLQKTIDVDHTLSFLQQLANAAVVCGELTLQTFWKCVSFTYTLYTLNKAQSLPQILASLSILRTSVLEGSFGAIAAEEETQAKLESALLDRLTSLLFEVPVADAEDEDGEYTRQELEHLRMGIVEVLRDICGTTYGSRVLSAHRNTIARLARFLWVQTEELYTLPAPFKPKAEVDSATASAHTLLLRSIAYTTQILYTLLLPTTSRPVDLLAKLGAVHGGYNKFLISMTRIAFSDAESMWWGPLGEETREAAHEILDEVLSPEEGEGIVKAVGTPGGTRERQGEEMDVGGD